MMWARDRSNGTTWRQQQAGAAARAWQATAEPLPPTVAGRLTGEFAAVTGPAQEATPEYRPPEESHEQRDVVSWARDELGRLREQMRDLRSSHEATVAENQRLLALLEEKTSANTHLVAGNELSPLGKGVTIRFAGFYDVRVTERGDLEVLAGAGVAVVPRGECHLTLTAVQEEGMDDGDN